MTLIPYVRLIRQFAERTPQRVTVVLEDESITCEQLERRSNRLARAYAAQGVRAGDFVVDGSLRGRVERLGNLMAGA